MSWRQSRYSMENGRGASNSQAEVFSQSSRLSEWTDRTPAEPLLNDVQDLSLPLPKIRRGGTRDESEVGSLQTVRSSGAVYEIPGLLGGSDPRRVAGPEGLGQPAWRSCPAVASID
jgi:hypothetical protein